MSDVRTILGLAPVDLDVERRFGPPTYTEEQVKAYHAALSPPAAEGKEDAINWQEVADARAEIIKDLAARYTLARMTLENAVTKLGSFAAVDDVLSCLRETMTALRTGDIEGIHTVDTPAPAAEPVITRDEIARMAWLVFGDDLSVEDAMSPSNDAHWNAWRNSEPVKSAFVMADAILSKLKENGLSREGLGGLARSLPSGDAQERSPVPPSQGGEGDA